MKQIFYLMAAALTLLCTSCSKITDLDNRLSKVEEKVQTLEEKVSEINSSIDLLRASIAALEARDYITKVTKNTDASGKVTGYTLSFNKAGDITITNGKDAEAPVIGAKEYQGVYYWTVNGEWMLDASGNKLRVTGEKGDKGETGDRGSTGAQGEQGQQGDPGAQGESGEDGDPGSDGVTPILKIESDYWYVSYDNKQTWTKLGIATTAGGDSIFSAVYEENGEVVLVLRDGNTYRVPVGAYLSIEFDTDDLVPASEGDTREIHYTVKSSDSSAQVEVISSSDIKAKVIPDGTSGLSGCIEATLLSKPDEEFSKIVVLCSNQTKIVMHSLYFEQSRIEVVSDPTINVSEKGGSISLNFLSNVPFEIIIPEQAKSWISYNPSKTLKPYSILLDIASAEGQFSRSAEVTVASTVSSQKLVYTIVQYSSSSDIFVIHHINTEFNALNMSGTGLSAIIDWGDGEGYQNWYPGLEKKYTDGAKSHDVVVQAKNLNTIELTSLSGVTTIDLSKIYN